ncbi:hypothetical protein PNQ29_00595 [Halobacterium salinarum]|nr:hypothetical protein [Halobacterium salinarum]MDL0118258.1 hypothetical protein [Halobacterium salinarum]
MIELHPLLKVILAGLFLAGFAIASVRNSGSEGDDEDDNESQQARDRDE